MLLQVETLTKLKVITQSFYNLSCVFAFKLTFKAIVYEDSIASCVVAIDELNLTPEPCTSINEGI